MSVDQAALYEAPFEHVLSHVKPFRDGVRRSSYRTRWWLHAEPVSGLRRAVRPLGRYIATPAISKHRLFVWVPSGTLADHRLVVVARGDDYTLGLLQSRVHESWALLTGARLETRPSYTPTTTFETFPFPRPTDEQRAVIGAAARRLVELRDGWLNPPGLSNADLAKRTLTNLYNERPTWLANVHSDLDRAVLAAYGWLPDLPDDEILARLLALNFEREPV